MSSWALSSLLLVLVFGAHMIAASNNAAQDGPISALVDDNLKLTSASLHADDADDAFVGPMSSVEHHNNSNVTASPEIRPLIRLGIDYFGCSKRPSPSPAANDGETETGSSMSAHHWPWLSLDPRTNNPCNLTVRIVSSSDNKKETRPPVIVPAGADAGRRDPGPVVSIQLYVHDDDDDDDNRAGNNRRRNVVQLGALSVPVDSDKSTSNEALEVTFNPMLVILGSNESSSNYSPSLLSSCGLYFIDAVVKQTLSRATPSEAAGKRIPSAAWTWRVAPFGTKEEDTPSVIAGAAGVGTAEGKRTKLLEAVSKDPLLLEIITGSTDPSEGLSLLLMDDFEFDWLRIPLGVECPPMMTTSSLSAAGNSDADGSTNFRLLKVTPESYAKFPEPILNIKPKNAATVRNQEKIIEHIIMTSGQINQQQQQQHHQGINNHGIIHGGQGTCHTPSSWMDSITNDDEVTDEDNGRLDNCQQDNYQQCQQQPAQHHHQDTSCRVLTNNQSKGRKRSIVELVQIFRNPSWQIATNGGDADRTDADSAMSGMELTAIATATMAGIEHEAADVLDRILGVKSAVEAYQDLAQLHDNLPHLFPSYRVSIGDMTYGWPHGAMQVQTSLHQSALQRLLVPRSFWTPLYTIAVYLRRIDRALLQKLRTFANIYGPDSIDDEAIPPDWDSFTPAAGDVLLATISPNSLMMMQQGSQHRQQQAADGASWLREVFLRTQAICGPAFLIFKFYQDGFTEPLLAYQHQQQQQQEQRGSYYRDSARVPVWIDCKFDQARLSGSAVLAGQTCSATPNSWTLGASAVLSSAGEEPEFMSPATVVKYQSGQNLFETWTIASKGLSAWDSVRAAGTLQLAAKTNSEKLRNRQRCPNVDKFIAKRRFLLQPLHALLDGALTAISALEEEITTIVVKMTTNSREKGGTRMNNNSSSSSAATSSSLLTALMNLLSSRSTTAAADADGSDGRTVNITELVVLEELAKIRVIVAAANALFNGLELGESEQLLSLADDVWRIIGLTMTDPLPNLSSMPPYSWPSSDGRHRGSSTIDPAMEVIIQCWPNKKNIMKAKGDNQALRRDWKQSISTLIQCLLGMGGLGVGVGQKQQASSASSDNTGYGPPLFARKLARFLQSLAFGQVPPGLRNVPNSEILAEAFEMLMKAEGPELLDALMEAAANNDAGFIYQQHERKRSSVAKNETTRTSTSSPPSGQQKPDLLGSFLTLFADNNQHVLADSMAISGKMMLMAIHNGDLHQLIHGKRVSLTWPKTASASLVPENTMLASSAAAKDSHTVSSTTSDDSALVNKALLQDQLCLYKAGSSIAFLDSKPFDRPSSSSFATGGSFGVPDDWMSIAGGLIDRAWMTRSDPLLGPITADATSDDGLDDDETLELQDLNAENAVFWTTDAGGIFKGSFNIVTGQFYLTKVMACGQCGARWCAAAGQPPSSGSASSGRTNVSRSNNNTP